jgi:hypothetical protein
MNKFENFIYLSICDITMSMFKKTKFMTYINYCRSMHDSIINNNLSKIERDNLIAIVNHLKLLYNLDDDEIINHITNYFISDKVVEMQKIIMLTKEIFPITGDV